MKNLFTLLKIEYIYTKRNLSTFVIGIGLPVGLLFLITSMMTSNVPAEYVPIFVRDFMVSMAIYSSLSFALFTFPLSILSDRNCNWLLFVEQSPIKIWLYYFARFIRIIFNFIISIIVVFLVAKYFKNVDLTIKEWLVATLLTLFSSSCMLSVGVLLTSIKNEEKLSIVANVLYIILGMIGGLWWPISQFPETLKVVAKIMPTHHARELVVNYFNNHEIAYNSLLILIGYAIIVLLITIIVKRKMR